METRSEQNLALLLHCWETVIVTLYVHALDDLVHGTPAKG